MVTKERSFGAGVPGRTVSGGGGTKGTGGDGPRQYPEPPADDVYEKSFAKSHVLTWFLLLVVLMTFGGVIGAYIVISTNGVLEWRPFDLPVQVWISTAVIIASSVTYVLAEKAVKDQIQAKAKNWLVATTVLGATFVSSQFLAWFALVQRGVYVQSNPYAGFFYILTALHAIHVAGGIVALGYVVLLAWDRARFAGSIERVKEIASSVGWYWHFMGGLWIVLFILLGFWK